MKNIIRLSIMFLIMSMAFIGPIVSGQNLLVVDDKGLATDVLITTSLTSFLAGRGESSRSLLGSEYDEPSEDGITVLVSFGKALLIYPEEKKSLAESARRYLIDEHEIEPTMRNLDETVIDTQAPFAFSEEVEEEELPKESRSIYFVLDEISKDNAAYGNEVLIIHGKDDIEYVQPIIDGYFSQSPLQNRIVKATEDVTAADMLNRDVLIIGGPCAVPQWSMFSDERCESWNLVEGEGIIRKANLGDSDVILIAGTSKDDTGKIVKMMSSGNLDDLLREYSSVAQISDIN